MRALDSAYFSASALAQKPGLPVRSGHAYLGSDWMVTGSWGTVYALTHYGPYEKYFWVEKIFVTAVPVSRIRA